MERKKWKDLVTPGHAFHISRNLMNRREPILLHDHDFAEILWLAHGNGVHRINGRVEKLLAGDLVMILPTDAHSLAPIGGATLNICNVVISAPLVTQLRRQWLESEARWFTRRGAGPATVRLSADQLDALNREFDWLAHAPRTRQSLVTFCLNLMRLIGADTPMDAQHRLPPWLVKAMRTFLPAGGSEERPTLHRFFAAAGRSPEHVARVMRQHLNTTPTAWVNHERIQYAARLLEISDRTVLEAALDSGFENAGHFHRLFREAFGTTPKRYRDRYRRAV